MIAAEATCPACPSGAERLILAGLRAWALGRIEGGDPRGPVREAVSAAASDQAGALFVAWMQAVEQAARRTLEISCLHCRGASLDEQRLVVACGLAPVAFEMGEGLLQPLLVEARPAMVLARALNRALGACGLPLPVRLEGRPADHGEFPTVH
jgi:hypothetical protein